jgi:hypothetical protein
MGVLDKRTAVAALAATLAVAPVAADEVLLRGGGRLQGVVVERTATSIVVETGPGRVTLSLSRVEKVIEGRSALDVYRERAGALDTADAAGWATLARWAAARDLATQAREAWARVLRAEPSHPEANAALDRVPLDGSWVPEEEAWQARGYVPFEGRWVTPAEHEAIVRERAADEASRREGREAEARVREAEARAREAEARAREAEAGAQGTQDEGIPLWWGWGGGVPLPPIDPWPPDPPPVHPPLPTTPPPSAWHSTPYSPPAPAPAPKPN